ncbi:MULTISPECIES: MarR family winged helix-turn-helix transcriptional regulator [Clostridium]|jgi:DNA-binding MarR family transcriptional regulator|uniref:Winged helix-turn-helix transcriptional regulator n=2 Tax=Clostridium beijerinckii TaxID=1520 RepID=A0AAW3WA94_CLOBE|nr:MULTISPECIES: MarR family winged helix-turn-helix transcriptional regulator [Clostridium]AVK47346.1 MarR family transcriptional regulator [Clostridium sp. MF28]MBC2458334.1 winged helix-turn-helix transcriptional regulator [Clostridium beijerinckii]MBC2475744.1 winged helix-turn-helix transcriptional regulator [Clostridium beijerinckii]MCI1579260.1 MarR family winged helix-turn-helix transcriptional regulator [Clostridium beijerinckii]MCI1585131.1 MarR family winged helix-turn-helix transcr
MDKEVHIGKKLSMLSRRLHRRIDKEASEYGVTGVQARILGFIYHKSDKKDIFQKDIEEELDIRRSSVTSVLQLMEKNGHIKRISVSEDARLKKIVLTEKGLEIQRNVYEFILRVEKSLRDELNEDEFNILVSLIDRLAKKIAD